MRPFLSLNVDIYDCASKGLLTPKPTFVEDMSLPNMTNPDEDTEIKKILYSDNLCNY